MSFYILNILLCFFISFSECYSTDQNKNDEPVHSEESFINDFFSFPFGISPPIDYFDDKSENRELLYEDTLGARIEGKDEDFYNNLNIFSRFLYKVLFLVPFLFQIIFHCFGIIFIEILFFLRMASLKYLLVSSIYSWLSTFSFYYFSGCTFYPILYIVGIINFCFCYISLSIFYPKLVKRFYKNEDKEEDTFFKKIVNSFSRKNSLSDKEKEKRYFHDFLENRWEESVVISLVTLIFVNFIFTTDAFLYIFKDNFINDNIEDSIENLLFIDD